MQIRVAAHLDCGHLTTGVIEEVEVNMVLDARTLPCPTCAADRRKGVVTMEEVRPLRVA